MFSIEIEVQTHSINSVQLLAADIAHEVRNPLTAVKGFLKLLKEETDHPYLMTMVQELDNALAPLTKIYYMCRSQNFIMKHLFRLICAVS